MEACIDGILFISKKHARHRFRANILSAWGHRCAYCGEPATTLDHVHPMSRGGLTVPENLVACCLECNRRKGSQDVWAWWRAQTFWRVDRELDVVEWLDGFDFTL
jgi:5-methylcytosine-specific restriction endonuclease McrA